MSLGLRHIQKRKKVRDSSFPTRVSVKRHMLDLIMYPIAIVAPLALVPQVYKLYSTQEAEGYALTTWVILGCVGLMWVWYGRVHREWPIIIANLMFASLHLAIVVGILLYS